MRCCVIGGAGFIGNHLVNVLLQTGRDVVVVGRRPRDRVSLPANVEYLQGDISNREFVIRFLRDVDEVIDLAHSSVPKTSYENPVLDIMDNLPGSVSLFEAACEFPIKKMLFVSSGGTIYGEPQSLPIDEAQPTNPVSPYGITKLALEKYAQMYHRTRGLPVVCARPSNPYGEGQQPFSGQGFIATAIASILAEKEIKIFGTEGTIRDYIYISDVARGLVAALDFGVPGECYNIGSSQGKSNIEVIEQISVCAKKHNMKPFVTNEASRLFDVSANVLSNKKLSAISGWRPEIAFETGIEHMWDYYLKHAKAGIN
jgi:UDP-glucose 4-epimerase